MDSTVERAESNSLRVYLKHMGSFDLLDEGEILPLVRDIRAGIQEAFERFTEANLRLVVAIAKRYRGLGVELTDLIQAGNLGLMEAVRKYDPEQHCTQFSTYATDYVRGKILNELSDHSRTIRIPEERMQSILRIGRIVRKFGAEFSREPTIEEISDLSGLTSKKVKDLLDNFPDTVSLSTPLGDMEDDGTLGDKVEDPGGVSPERIAEQNEIAGLVEGILDQLASDEQQFLRLRFNLDGGGYRSYREIIEQLQQIDQIGRKPINANNITIFELRLLAKLKKMALAIRYPKSYSRGVESVA